MVTNAEPEQMRNVHVYQRHERCACKNNISGHACEGHAHFQGLQRDSWLLEPLLPEGSGWGMRSQPAVASARTANAHVKYPTLRHVGEASLCSGNRRRQG